MTIIYSTESLFTALCGKCRQKSSQSVFAN